MIDPDTKDPVTGMSPREAAEAIDEQSVGIAAQVLESAFSAGVQSEYRRAILSRPDAAHVKTTLRNYHASRSAAVAEENKRLKEALAALHYGTPPMACNDPDCRICALLESNRQSEAP